MCAAVAVLVAPVGGCLDSSEKTACTADIDCLDGRVCQEMRCEEAGPTCDFDYECPDRHSCEDGHCKAFSVVEFVAAWTDTWCTASARCCPALDMPERLISCRAQPLFTGLVDEPVRLVDDAVTCLTRTAQMNCDQASPNRWFFLPGEEPCMRVVVDHARPVGESCDPQTLCAQGVCAGGVCVARGEGESCCVEIEGEPTCDSVVCSGDLWCDPATTQCRSALQPGTSCSFHQQCESTLCEPSSATCVVPSFVSAWCPI